MEGGASLNEQALGELSAAWNHCKPNDQAYMELVRILRGFESDDAAVLDGDDGPRICVLAGDRIVYLSTNDSGVIVESRRLSADLAIRREPGAREHRTTRGGVTSRWVFASPTDRELCIKVDGWVSDHQEPDRPEAFAVAIASRVGWLGPEGEE